MVYKLDEDIKLGLDSLTIEETKRSISYSYEHEILWYGIDAVTHVYLMRQAKNIGAKEFVSRYILDQDLNKGGAYPFCYSKTIENDGIFIPKRRYYNSWDRVYTEKAGTRLFDSDYNNRINDIWNLTSKRGNFKFEDFENTSFLKNGNEFGIALWERSLEGFEKYLNYKTPQPENVTFLARKLIDYYSKIIFDK